MITSRAIVQEQRKLGRALVRRESLVNRVTQICAVAALRADLKEGI